MKDNLSDSSSDNQKTALGTAKSKLSMLKRSSTKQKAPASSTSDPFRFHERGVDFKGKLIGDRDVTEARGDAMCADAMKLVKNAVKAAGAHKTRINAMKEEVGEDGIRVENGLRMADLIDLESELEHIAIGFNQLQNIPSMPEDSWPTTSSSSTGDPFGTSFNSSTQNTSITSSSAGTTNGFDPFGTSSFNTTAPALPPPSFQQPTQQ
uniref:Uncharacterized protein n=1 Tax=Panagrolaimus sp. ES5 TaxID=591445 RepID=A0AC34G831_9BILA